ncbi:DUF2244 domain-containing protein [Algirhabdus cladophorae]|uniref:DUF2244 domain-containing protein n=1 Tax=Algirhabdus cladophorae TaxID=3377108 RepID=UPI003B84646F
MAALDIANRLAKLTIMPYEWTPSQNDMRLSAWPYRSLLRKDFVLFMGGTMAIIALPLLAVLGSPVLWGVFPFFAIMFGGLWYALQRNHKDGEILEELTLSHAQARLVRHNPRAPKQEWQANTHWVSVHMHPTGGPIKHYVTLRGEGREVEIGSFLSEDERKALYQELQQRLVEARS